jgi:hypothetical protein
MPVLRGLTRRQNLVALVLVWLAVTLLLQSTQVVGHLLIDDGLYHIQARAMATDLSLEAWNGYEEFATKELWIYSPVGPWMVPAKGVLVAQYPPLHALLVAPLYALMGLSGLFLFTNMCFSGLLIATGILGHKVTGSRALGFVAVVILALGSFAVDYSQSIWPHAQSCLLTVLVWLALERTLEDERWAVVAGLLVGLGVGFRVDRFFLLLPLAAALIAARGIRLRALLAMGLGVLPMLVAMSLANLARFGIWWPFSYGPMANSSSVSFYARFAPLMLGFLLIVLWQIRIRDKRWPFGVAVGMVVMGAVLAPPVRSWFGDMSPGFWGLLVDFRQVHGGEPIRPFGQAIKFTALQSLPYLPLLLIPAVRGKAAVRRLLLVPLMLLLIFAPAGWEGGHCLDVRYFVSGLPFVAILAAWSLRHLCGDRYRIFVGGWAVAVSGLWLAMGDALPEAVLLDFPLQLAAALAVTVVLTLVRPGLSLVSHLTAGLGVLGIAWAGAVTFGYIVPRTHAERQANRDVAAALSPMIAPDALLFYEGIAPMLGLVDRGDVRLARPLSDRFEDFDALVQNQEGLGHPIYAAFKKDVWGTILGGGYLDGVEVSHVGWAGEYHLGQLHWVGRD